MVEVSEVGTDEVESSVLSGKMYRTSHEIIDKEKTLLSAIKDACRYKY